MTRYLELTTSANSKIKIKLLDNNFVDDFCQQLEFVKNTWNFTQYKEHIPMKQCKDWDQIEVNQQVSIIVDAIQNLNKLGCKFPIGVDKIILQPDMPGRQLLNCLHRHFTTGHRSVSYREPVFTWLDNSDLTFNLDLKNYEQFQHYVHDINDCVHRLEPFYYFDRHQTFATPASEYNIIFKSWDPIDSNCNPQTKYFVPLNSDYYQFFSNDPDFDVWLPSGQIQGKNWWKAYFDYDDPTHWDIDLNINYTGSFSIGKRPHTQDKDFLTWLRSYGIESGPQHVGMPLGNIVSGREIAESLGPNNFICQIDLIALE